MLFCLIFTFHFSLFTLGAAAQDDPSHQQFLFAYKLMQRGESAEAGAEFEVYLREYPRGALVGDAAYYRALLHRQAGRSEQALAVLSSVEEASLPGARLVPPFAVALLRGQLLTDAGRFDEALAVLERIDASALDDKTRPAVEYLRGLAYRGAGNLPAASAALREVVEQDTGATGRRARIDLARVLVQLEKGEEAVAVLQGAMEPADAAITPTAARLAGDIAYQLGDYDGAIAAYDRVLQSYQTSVEYAPAALGKLWALSSAGRHEQAVQAGRTLAETLRAEALAEALYLVGSSLQQLGRHEEALQRLEPIAQQTGSSDLRAKALYRSAVSYQAMDRHEDVGRIADVLQRDFPGSELAMDAAFLKASSIAQQQGAEQGVAALTQLIQQGAGSGLYRPSLLRRARLYEDRGLFEAALADYEAYLQAGEADVPVSLRYAELSGRLGQFEQATTALRSLLSMPLTPAQQQEAMFRLADVQASAGDDAEALATLERLRREHPLHAFMGEATLKRGALLVRAGKTAEAVQSLIAASDSEALSMPQRVLALRTVAQVYRENDRPGDAAVTLARVVGLDQASQLSNGELLWLARWSMEHTAEASGDPAAYADRLLSVLQPAERAKSDAESAELAYLRGRLAMMKGDEHSASEALAEAVARGEGFDQPARILQARLAAVQGRFEQALAELNELMGVENPAVAAEALATLGELWRERAQQIRRTGGAQSPSEAVAEARRALKRLVLLYLDVEAAQPWPQRGLMQLGEIAEEWNEPDAALREWKQLAESFEGTPYGRYASAKVALLERNRPDDALATLESLRGQTLDMTLAGRVAALRGQLEKRRGR